VITASIDLRADHGAVRHQGPRQACLAFSLSDLNGHQHGQPGALSPEYLFREAAMRMPSWRPGEGLDLHATLQAVDVPGQPLESDCPYLSDEPVLPLASFGPYAPMFRGAYGAFAAIGARVTATLNQGASVGLVLRVTPEFFYPDKDSGEVEFSASFLPGHVHAVLAVGTGQNLSSGEAYFLIRNSWGIDWGKAGHAWLPERYITTHALCAFGV